jgi:hypothetical protein
MTVELDKLRVRFNDETYRAAKMARVNYQDEDHFVITWVATDEVKIESKFKDPRGFDPDKWKIEVRDRDHFVKVSINNTSWIIEKWIRERNENVLIKYGRTMKGFLDVKVDYGKPRQ